MLNGDYSYIQYNFRTLGQIICFINNTKDIKHINDTLDFDSFNLDTLDVESLGKQKLLDTYYYSHCGLNNVSYLWKQLHTLKLKDGDQETTLAKVLLVNHIKRGYADDHMHQAKNICKIIEEDAFSLSNDYFGIDINDNSKLNNRSCQTYEFIVSNGPEGKSGFDKLVREDNFKVCRDIIENSLEGKNFVDDFHYSYRLRDWINYYEKNNSDNKENYWLQVAVKLFSAVPHNDPYMFKSGIQNVLYGSKNTNGYNDIIKYIKGELLKEHKATQKRAYIDVNSIIRILIDIKIINLEDILQLM